MFSGVSEFRRILDTTLVGGAAAAIAFSPFAHWFGVSTVTAVRSVLSPSWRVAEDPSLPFLVTVAISVAAVLISVIAAVILMSSRPSWEIRHRVLQIALVSGSLYALTYMFWVGFAATLPIPGRLAFLNIPAQTPLFVCLSGQVVSLRRVYGGIWAFRPGSCLACRYDLVGISASRCPECGADVAIDGLRRPTNLSLGSLCFWFNVAAVTASGFAGESDKGSWQVRHAAPFPLALRAFLHLWDAVGRVFDFSAWSPSQTLFPMAVMTTVPLLASCLLGWLSANWIGSARARGSVLCMLLVWVPYLVWLMREQVRLGVSFMELAQALPMIVLGYVLIRHLPEFASPIKGRVL